MRILMAACALVLAGCGKEASSPEAANAAPAAAPTKQADEPQAGVAVTGRLRAHDGTPLRQAEFAVTRMGLDQPVASGALGADGSFRVEVEPGAYVLRVAAVDHAPIEQPLLVERAVEVEGNLGTLEREEPGETLSLQSVFVDATGEMIAPGPKSATRAADGTYHVALTDAPKQAVRLRYGLAEGGPGPLADSYDHVGGAFWSVVSLAGREALVLDLAALPPAGKPSQLTWQGVPPELLAVQAYQQKWQPRAMQVYERILESGGSLTEPGEQEKAELATLAAEALAEADAAGSDDARVLLRLAYFELFAAESYNTAARAHAEWIVDHVDPQDRRLALFHGVHRVLPALVTAAADKEITARVEQWYARAQANPDAATAIAAVSFLLQRADDSGDEARVKELYAVALEPRFAGMSEVELVKELFNPDRPLQRGKRLPDFEYPGLNPDDPPIKSADRAGRLYLVEFWATWCGPCLVAMPDLHAAYAKVNGAQPGEGEAGLRRLAPVEQPKVEFVFVSLDAGPEDVTAFRAAQWSMPWTHAFAGFDRDGELRARYGFRSLPATVLVDGTGTIIELGEALHGARLLPTLERVLAEQ